MTTLSFISSRVEFLSVISHRFKNEGGEHKGCAPLKKF